MCAGVFGANVIKMRLLLCLLWFSSYSLKSCFSSLAGISSTMPAVLNTEDKNELRAVFNLTGFLSMPPSKNYTKSSSNSFHIVGYIDMIISSSEAFRSRKRIVDLVDASTEENEPVFRKDYTLDEQKQGWYKLHRVPETWDDARDRCELEGAELASPLNLQIHQAMLSNMGDVLSVFTGVHSLFSYGDYFSIKGIPLYEMPVNWTSIPSSDKKRRCVALIAGGTIDNFYCQTVTMPYICRKDNNNTLVTECGTIDTEYTLNTQLNTCYKLHTEKKNWYNAFKTCSAEGGHLVVINSDAEMSTVAQLMSKDKMFGMEIDYSVSVGILNWQATGKWFTIHGQQLEKSGFSTWGVNNQQYGYDCGTFKRTGLMSVQCFNENPFVCEKKPDSLIGN